MNSSCKSVNILLSTTNTNHESKALKLFLFQKLYKEIFYGSVAIPIQHQVSAVAVKTCDYIENSCSTKHPKRFRSRIANNLKGWQSGRFPAIAQH